MAKRALEAPCAPSAGPFTAWPEIRKQDTDAHGWIRMNTDFADRPVGHWRLGPHPSPATCGGTPSPLPPGGRGEGAGGWGEGRDALSGIGGVRGQKGRIVPVRVCVGLNALSGIGGVQGQKGRIGESARGRKAGQLRLTVNGQAQAGRDAKSVPFSFFARTGPVLPCLWKAADGEKGAGSALRTFSRAVYGLAGNKETGHGCPRMDTDEHGFCGSSCRALEAGPSPFPRHLRRHPLPSPAGRERGGGRGVG